jgi:hypothetical protein
VNVGPSDDFWTTVIEHHPAVKAHADWIIDLRPGAGHDGRQIAFEGSPGRPGGGAVDADR